jgi:hypothetical protein
VAFSAAASAEAFLLPWLQLSNQFYFLVELDELAVLAMVG